jgi:hypothetical protein
MPDDSAKASMTDPVGTPVNVAMCVAKAIPGHDSMPTGVVVACGITAGELQGMVATSFLLRSGRIFVAVPTTQPDRRSGNVVFRTKLVRLSAAAAAVTTAGPSAAGGAAEADGATLVLPINTLTSTNANPHLRRNPNRISCLL